MLRTILRILKHRWLDLSDARKAIPVALSERLAARVAASEARHTGEVRICVEAGLPLSYLWRRASARERAINLFSKLRVWDTPQNNGVLIYLLLAEHAIEIVADRGLARHVPQPVWETLASQLSAALRSGHTAEGLLQALADVSALLELHSPSDASTAEQPRRNELPDAPCIASK